MRQISLYCATALLLVACNHIEKHMAATAPQNTDLIQQILKGKVKSFEASSTIIDSTGASKKDPTVVWNEFNEQGYQTAEINRDTNGKTTESRSFTRFDNGQLKELLVKNGEGKQITKWEITIDSNGKYNGATVYDSNNVVTSVWKNISENEYGQVTKGTEYKKDGTLKSSFEQSYKGASMVSASGRDSSGKEDFKSSIKLNDKGENIEETVTSTTKDTTKTEVTTWKYDSYDDQGNWTQKSVFTNGKLTKVIRRKFEYYKN